MYKNVSNHHIAALFLLLSSCFSAKAQYISANTATTFANATIKPGKKADQPAPDEIITSKPAETDTSWKPVRRLWGYAFGDLYYNAHADAANRGAETNYNGVPTYRNAFQFRRVYLGYEYDIDKTFSVELLLASEPSANTNVSGTTSISGSDNLADNKMAFYIKLINLRWKGLWKGTDLVVGQTLTPAFPMLTEKIWGYRAIEKTISDFHRTNAFDIGASLQGTFDPATKNFGYDLMVGDNTQAGLLSAANANTGFFKAFYGDVYARFLNQTLIFDLYADYMQTASGTATMGQQSHSMFKGFAAYTTPKITFGIEAYTQQIANGVNNVTLGHSENARVNAFSVYTHGAITKDKVGFFARYDGYNPDADFTAANVYTTNTNFAAYSPYTKEHFVTAGLDFTPTKNVHFMPNLWLIQYLDQRDPSVTGYIPDSHVLVYRATFYFTFGK